MRTKGVAILLWSDDKTWKLLDEINDWSIRPFTKEPKKIHIHWREYSLIRGPNPLHSLTKDSLYYDGPLKAWPVLISAHKSYFIALTSIQEQSKLMWKEKIGK